MNFKIITLPKTQTEICLHRDRSEENEEIVRITTWVTNSENEELLLDSEVTFPDSASARCFVSDYSESSAECFLKEYLKEEKIWLD